jgi:hypothetical protein
MEGKSTTSPNVFWLSFLHFCRANFSGVNFTWSFVHPRDAMRQDANMLLSALVGCADITLLVCTQVEVLFLNNKPKNKQKCDRRPSPMGAQVRQAPHSRRTV